MNKLAIVFIFLCALPGKAFCELSVSEKTSYYAVAPTSVSEMVSIFNNSSPIRQNGKTFLGYTNWQVSWKWRTRSKNSRCRIKHVNSFVNIEYTIPKLAPRYYEADILFIWDKWFPNLMKHEQKHAQYAIEMAKKGENEILNLPSQKNCEELNKIAEALTEKLTDDLKVVNILYDVRTQHGKSEGADLSQYM